MREQVNSVLSVFWCSRLPLDIDIFSKLEQDRQGNNKNKNKEKGEIEERKEQEKSEKVTETLGYKDKGIMMIH